MQNDIMRTFAPERQISHTNSSFSLFFRISICMRNIESSSSYPKCVLLYHLLRLGAPVDFGRRGRSRSGGGTHPPTDTRTWRPNTPNHSARQNQMKKKKTRSPRVPLNTYPANVCSFLLFMNHMHACVSTSHASSLVPSDFFSV